MNDRLELEKEWAIQQKKVRSRVPVQLLLCTVEPLYTTN